MDQYFYRNKKIIKLSLKIINEEIKKKKKKNGNLNL